MALPIALFAPSQVGLGSHVALVPAAVGVVLARGLFPPQVRVAAEVGAAAVVFHLQFLGGKFVGHPVRHQRGVVVGDRETVVLDDVFLRAVSGNLQV